MNCERANGITLSSEIAPGLRNQELALDRCRTLPFLLYDGDAEVFSLFGFPGPATVSTKVSRQATSTLPLDSMLTGNYDGLCEQAILDFNLHRLGDMLDDDPFMGDGVDWIVGCATALPEADTFGIVRNERRIADLAAAIMSSSPNTRETETERQTGLSILQDLLSPAQAHRFVSRYFETWHPICSIIHRPTFTADSTADSTLLAILILGAIYSPDDEDRQNALSVIDYVEDYVFSQAHSDANSVVWHGKLPNDDDEFHFLQASFLLVVAQYWSGSDRSRRRVSTSRFDRVLESARRLGSFRITHTADDRTSQNSWLARECHIRTSTWITLLDCAFSFFWGIPTRIVSHEVMCDLPCLDIIFNERDPFTHYSFTFSRNLTALTAFRALFENTDTLELTMLDTFVLIHLLYRFVVNALSLQLWRTGSVQDGLAFSGMGSDVSKALDCWHRYWEQLHKSAVDRNIWNELKFWKYGDQFEYAIRFLLSARARPHLNTFIAVGIPRLERFNAVTSC